MVTIACLFCGKDVVDYKWRKRKFCNRSCAMKLRNQNDNPAKKRTWKDNPKMIDKMMDVLATNKKNRILKSGEEHHNWMGKTAKYATIHQWVIRNFGSPEKCSNCSIKNTRIEWANRDHKYNRTKEDWIPLCTKCHRRYDKENNGGNKK